MVKTLKGINIPLNRAEGDLEIRVEIEDGIITEAWVRLRKKPTFRASASVRFKDFFSGADAVRGRSRGRGVP